MVIQRGHEENIGIIAASEAEIIAEKRRQDRKEQYHKQVWTKAAHGGPYRKVRHSRSIFAAKFDMTAFVRLKLFCA